MVEGRQPLPALLFEVLEQYKSSKPHLHRTGKEGDQQKMFNPRDLLSFGKDHFSARGERKRRKNTHPPITAAIFLYSDRRLLPGATHRKRRHRYQEGCTDLQGPTRRYDNQRTNGGEQLVRRRGFRPRDSASGCSGQPYKHCSSLHNHSQRPNDSHRKAPDVGRRLQPPCTGNSVPANRAFPNDQPGSNFQR